MNQSGQIMGNEGVTVTATKRGKRSAVASF